MHPDQADYWRFTSRSRLIKSVESVAGLIAGIDIDRDINPAELGFLYDWIDAHTDVSDRHPFNEIVPMIVGALEDGHLGEEEKHDILWLCDRLTGDCALADQVTADVRRLHGVLGGVIADGLILERELDGLREWLTDHEHLKTIWPYDETDALLTSVLADRRISSDEHDTLMGFFAEFVEFEGNRGPIAAPPVLEGMRLTGLCSVCPDIVFGGKTFCFTGGSSKYLRNQLASMVTARGGFHSESVTKKTDYLIVGAEGNPCWAYACYGRKVEAAIKWRRQGLPMLIVHEHDFHDAVADTPAA